MNGPVSHLIRTSSSKETGRKTGNIWTLNLALEQASNRLGKSVILKTSEMQKSAYCEEFDLPRDNGPLL